MYVIISVDDSSRHNLRLARIIENYGLKATFFLDTCRIGYEMSVSDVRWLSDWNEIGSHGVSHKCLTCLSKREILHEIIVSKKYLEKIIEKPVLSFAYPYGSYNRTIINILQECGFLCGRTTAMLHCTIRDPFKIGVTWSADPISVYYFIIHNVKRLLEGSTCVQDFIDAWDLLTFIFKKLRMMNRWYALVSNILSSSILRKCQIFHLHLHANEIAKRGDWGFLEDILNLLSSLNNNITLGEAVRSSLKEGENTRSSLRSGDDFR